MKEEKITLENRLIAALMLGLCVAVTIIVLPFALTMFVGRSGIGLYGIYTTWAFKIIIAISAIIGFILGIDKSTTLMGHFWYTERPRNNKISFSLWAIILFVALLPVL